MRTAALALAAFEVAVRRCRAALPRCELVGVHAPTHRAAGLTPLSARGSEDLAQAFTFGLRTDPHRPWYDQHPHAVGHFSAMQDLGHRTQILDAAVGARSDEHRVDRNLAHRRP